ncbi:GTP cyclohydrolase II RibA [Marinobacterium rhizophilum]|uniref:GTP cyclohydrolase II RibA n=1 Tax=Marinobacterium rhizophilum TaxID=420402 RepID=UPI0009FCDC86|nr:GTP cyclohydrolase II RibA [Marinobacterium rhizophilum]
MYKNFLGERATIPSRVWGEITVESVELTDAVDGDLVLLKGDPFSAEAPLVRIHSECVFAEAFDSALCDCADQMHMALSEICKEGCGILFYLRIDGRGAGLSAKVKATALEVEGMDTHDSRISIGVSPDNRSFQKVAEYLVRNSVRKVRLLTNNPDKANGLKEFGIEVETASLRVPNPSDEVASLYRTKAEKFGHLIDD